MIMRGRFVITDGSGICPGDERLRLHKLLAYYKWADFCTQRAFREAMKAVREDSNITDDERC
jgi:hypothetical protein